jgi:hypothetical protein
MIRSYAKLLSAGAVLMAAAVFPAQAWNQTEQARLKAALGDTIVIVPIEAASGQPITQTDTLPDGTSVVRNVVCLDTVACKEVAGMAGMAETMRGAPYALVNIVELGTVDQFAFYTSSVNAGFANTSVNQPHVFFVSNQSGKALTETHGGVIYTKFFSDRRQAEEMQALAEEYLGPMDLSTIPLIEFIAVVASGELLNAVLHSPNRNAWWLRKWEGDNTLPIATAMD